METVQSDLKKYLEKNIFPTRTVLVFPPFNGFRRFLIHKLIEDCFASSEVAAFSIGQDVSRRIVVCYKGLIREGVNKTPSAILAPVKLNMIEKEKSSRQKSTPTAAVYRPPAARIAEARRSSENGKTDTNTKQARVRRPDQQMYVPRPKRVSYGNDLPRSRSQSSSRLSIDSEKNVEGRTNCSSLRNDRLRISKQDGLSKICRTEHNEGLPLVINQTKNDVPVRVEKRDNSQLLNTENYASCGENKDIVPDSITKCLRESNSNPIKADLTPVSIITCPEGDKSLKMNCDYIQTPTDGEMLVDCNDTSKNQSEICDKEKKKQEADIPSFNKNNDFESINSSVKMTQTPSEVMETISLSSDSRGEESSSTSGEFGTCETSKLKQNVCKHKTSEKMEVDVMDETKSKEYIRCEEKKINSHTNMVVSEVLVISESSSSNDSMKSAEDEVKNESSLTVLKDQPKLQESKIKKPKKESKKIDPNECDWESLYDDSGECLVPNLMEELTNSVGRVRVTSANSDYRPYQSIEERTNDGECIIEIYDFPAEFKTTDLFNIFAAYRNKNFQIKWVDDTHALGVFPSPLMADEVLACTLPFVKTRPLRLGIAESRNKARNLVLPPLPSMERPKTCTALARRLVSGALGLRIPTSSQEREKEKQVLKEAREKRRLEAKQRDAAWEGTITSGI